MIDNRMTRRLLGVIALLPFAGLAIQATAEEYRQSSKTGSATLRLEADKAPTQEGIEIRLSDLVPLTLTLDGPATLEVDKVDPVTKSEFWRIREVKPAEIVDLPEQKKRWRQEFILEPMNKGDLTLQVEPLRFRSEAGKGDWFPATFEPIKVKVMTSVVAPDVSQMRPITPPEKIPPVRPWWSGALRWGGLALVALALILGALELKRRFAPPKPELAPHEWAARELLRLEAMDLPRHGQAERFHTLLSDLMRRYLELRFRLRAPRQTTAEFLEAMRQAPQLTAEQRLLLRDFLERCDLAKFARAEFSVPECAATATMARTFIEQSRPAPEPALADVSKSG
jgi:hypothetical protein